MGLLEDKVALVTGSSRGIGKVIASAFSKEGADVIVSSRSVQDSEAVVEEIEKKFGTSPLAIKADVSKLSNVVRLFLRIVEKYGKLDVLVNNAGFPMAKNLWEKSFHDTLDEDFRAVGEVDLLGTVRCCREALKIMIRQRGGVIINVSSTPALVGYDKGAPYTAAKAGILGITKHLAYEYGSYNIRVNAVALGNVKTAGTYDSMSEEGRIERGEEAPLKRWGKPEEVATVCLFLASDQSSFMTGQTIVVDGGTVMR